MVEDLHMNTLKHISFSEMMKSERQLRYTQQIQKFEENWNKAKMNRQAMLTDRDNQTIARLVKKYEETESNII